ncbi:MAG: S9 family peptidase [Clostridia bacterium]|nr:S9 family peptidase [Clostridia bacterium]
MKKIDARTLFDFKYASAPRFSKNGEYIAYVVQRADEETNGYKGDIYLYDTVKGKNRRLTSAGDAKGYYWLDDGRIVFAASRDKEIKDAIAAGKELTAFYEIDPDGGEAVLSFTVPVSGASLKQIDEDNFIVSAKKDLQRPDTTGMSDADAKKAIEEYKNPAYNVLDEWPFWFNGAGFVSGKRSVLYTFNKKSGELKQLTNTDMDAGAFDYKDGKLLYSASLKNGEVVRMNYPGLFLLDLETMEKKTLIQPRTRRFGSAKFLNSNTVFLTSTEGEICGGNQYMDFYTMDIESGELKVLAKYEASIGSGSVGSDAKLGAGQGSKLSGDKFYFITTVDESAYLRVLDTKSGTIETLTGYGSCESFDEKDGKIVVCGMYGDDLCELYLDGNKITNVFDTSEYDVREREYYTFTNKDGIEIHGYCMKPAGYEPGKKYPAIFHIHGGPRTVFGGVFHHEMQVWANAGYFVFYTNPRGSDGRGNLFGDINGKYGTIDYDDLMEFTDVTLDRYPDIDRDRVGVGGGSYGGFMTNWIIGHTDRFKAAVSQRSIANWISFEHTTDIGISFVMNNIATNTRENTEKMWWHSPLKYADKCVTPTLFIHSDKDQRCWMVEGLSMFTALKLHGCEAKLCLFKNETHELSRSGKPKNRIARMTEILDWYDSHLKEGK